MNQRKTFKLLILNAFLAFLTEAATPTPIPTTTPVPLPEITIGWSSNLILLGALILVIIILAGIAWNIKQQR